MKTRVKNELLDLTAEVLGSFAVAVAFYNFTTAENIPMSGFSGIGLIFNRLFGLPVGMVVLFGATICGSLSRFARMDAILLLHEE